MGFYLASNNSHFLRFVTQKGPVKCNILYVVDVFSFFFCLPFSCCVKSTFLSTSTYDVFIFLAFFVIYLSITAAFQPLQVFSWTTEISPLYCSLLSLCPRRFSLTISSPSVYTTASRGNLILLLILIPCSVYVCLPRVFPSPSLSLICP